MKLHAQVPVHEEPRHHLIFKNNKVRVLDVRIPPGDTSLYHIHTTPSVFVFFTNSTNSSQLLGKDATYGKLNCGRIMFENLAAPNTRTHRVWNTDIDTFHVMDIELLYNDSGFFERALSDPNLKMEIDTGWVRAYRLILSKSNQFTLNNKKNSFLLISFDTTSLQIIERGKTRSEKLEAGDFLEIKTGETFSIKITSDEDAEFALLELPSKR